LNGPDEVLLFLCQAGIWPDTLSVARIDGPVVPVARGQNMSIRLRWSLLVSVLWPGTCLAEPPLRPVLKIGTVELTQTLHRDQLTGPGDHFGSLLFDSSGHLLQHAGHRTWMYTGGKTGDRWISFVREFDLDTLQVTARSKVLETWQSDRWATIHLAIQAADDLVVVFYSTGKMIRAAVGRRPAGPFMTDPKFGVRASQDWEINCSLESDCGFVAIAEDADELRIWMLYDTLGPGSTGQNGWAEVRIDKQTRRIELVRKHPDNPIPLLRPGFTAARTGGNIDSRVLFDGQHALFYLSKRDSRSYRIAVALSRDPLFGTLTGNQEMAGPLGQEAVIEKFQFYRHDGSLFLIYENASRQNDWRTSLRRYQMSQAPKR